MLALALALAACTTPPGPRTSAEPAPTADPRVPPAWQAAVPTSPEPSLPAADWWRTLDEAELGPLVAAARRASPDLASAAARIAEARANRVAAGAALLPGADLSAAAAYGRNDLTLPRGSSLTATLQASWELDLFGGLRAGAQAADRRLASAEAEAATLRTAVAAETATSWVSLRACEALARDAEQEAGSRAETLRLLARSRDAGFESPASVALAEAQAAQAAGDAVAQRAQCERETKSLVALTALDEPGLRRQLAPGTARLPVPRGVQVPAVPGEALAARPDLQARAQAVEAALAEIDVYRADERPRIVLSGSVTPTQLRAQGVTYSGVLWQVGPLQVSMPLFDGGRRRAATEAARARYDEAAAAYAAQLRQAVRDVEDALVRLEAAGRRHTEAARARDGYARSQAALAAREQAGLANRLEVEDARRGLLASQRLQVATAQEQVSAWIALVRALGGTWPEALNTATPASADAPPAPPASPAPS